MRNNRNRFAAVALAAISVPGLSFALAACGSSGSSSAPPAAGSSGTGGTSAAVVIKTVDNPQLGQILVDSSGMTLYRFDADSASPPTSNCSGSCATYWPPVLEGSSGAQAQGFAQSELGTVTRADGTKQVTVDGWPLYTYAGDKAAGQANGQDLNASGGVWWAVAPSGARASMGGSGSSGGSGSPSPSNSGGGSSSGGGGGYGY